MALNGYQRKTKPALWTTVVGARPVAGPTVKDRAASASERRQAKRSEVFARRIKIRLARPGERGKAEKMPLTSAEQAKRLERRLYKVEAREFVRAAVERGETCPVVAAIPELRNGTKYGWPVSDRLNEIHHIRGRTGRLLRDQRFWMAVSKQGHRWIHSNPAAARQRGWYAEKGDWNKSPMKSGVSLL